LAEPRSEARCRMSHQTSRRTRHDTRRSQFTRDRRVDNISNNRAGRHGSADPNHHPDQCRGSAISQSPTQEQAGLPVVPDHRLLWPRGPARQASDPEEVHGRLRRLLSPVEAADYLGLGSRFAIYRLVSGGQLPAVRLANKLRIDLRDLDGAIEQAKGGVSGPDAYRSGGPRRSRIVPRQLAPLRRAKKSVTPPVTVISSD
jgi:excisionase family DNA binding protein